MYLSFAQGIKTFTIMDRNIKKGEAKAFSFDRCKARSEKMLGACSQEKGCTNGMEHTNSIGIF
jgi:hypothetical protein